MTMTPVSKGDSVWINLARLCASVHRVSQASVARWIGFLFNFNLIAWADIQSLLKKFFLRSPYIYFYYIFLNFKNYFKVLINFLINFFFLTRAFLGSYVLFTIIDALTESKSIILINIWSILIFLLYFQPQEFILIIFGFLFYTKFLFEFTIE